MFPNKVVKKHVFYEQGSHYGFRGQICQNSDFLWSLATATMKNVAIVLRFTPFLALNLQSQDSKIIALSTELP